MDLPVPPGVPPGSYRAGAGMSKGERVASGRTCSGRSVQVRGGATPGAGAGGACYHDQMTKARKERGPAGRLGTLLEAGDHGAARREARRLLGDATTDEAGRREAAAVLASLEPEGGAVAVGLGGVALAAAIVGWLLTGH